MRLIDKDTLEEAVQGSINIMELHGISMIAASVPLAIIKGAPTVDAIPVEWLRDILQQAVDSGGRYRDVANGLGLVLAMWEEKQEAQDG